ncbi:MAG: DNA mismatch repair protein MutS, partial [Muriicola sp.]|nr:DNA mismatch repair protein MutS [Muriicola sp.]
MDTYLKKSVQDLEFATVRKQLTARCNTEMVKKKALTLHPLLDASEIARLLGESSEYLSSFSNNNRIPNHGFDTIGAELDLLKIENTTLELTGFR